MIADFCKSAGSAFRGSNPLTPTSVVNETPANAGVSSLVVEGQGVTADAEKCGAITFCDRPACAAPLYAAQDADNGFYPASGTTQIANYGAVDPEFLRLQTLWAQLPTAVRTAILAMAEAMAK